MLPFHIHHFQDLRHNFIRSLTSSTATMNIHDRLLRPDESILSHLLHVDILAQTLEVCTFRVQFTDSDLLPSCTTLLVRLQTEKDKLNGTISLERLAALQIPTLVPKRLRNGTVKNRGEVELGFSVTKFIEDGITLESVWQELDESTQDAIMNQIVSVIFQLHSLELLEESVRAEVTNLLTHTGASDDLVIPMGNADIGFHRDFLSLLKSLVANVGPKKGMCAVHDTNDGIIVVSQFADLGQVELSGEDLATLSKQLVLCHNDLEPRNIFVRPIAEIGKPERYELLAIIDWEMAGFFPFAYEYTYKDAVLGTSNLSLSWYNLFKRKTAPLVPKDQSTARFISAIDLIYASAERARQRNVGRRTRERWLAYHRLEKSLDVEKGWLLRDGENSVTPMSSEAFEALEQEVLKELGRI